MKIKNKLVSGALILSIGGFVTKILGAFYRIPLTNILGAEGIGIYQAVFPFYCLLLTASSTGVPNGISKLISQNENEGYCLLKSALKIFIPIGIAGSLIMLVFCKSLATIQGNYQAYFAYAMLSPSVLLVSVISCFRGFFQGLTDMKPTAISQIIEQAVKLVLGLTLCSFVSQKIYIKAGLATLAVSVSELITCLYFYVIFKKRGYSFKNFKSVKTDVKLVLKIVFPVMLSTIVIPSARTIESFFVLNVIGSYSNNATALYGLYSGAVESIVSVPVSICYAIAVTSVPIISKLFSENKSVTKKSNQAITYTLILGALFAIAFLTLSNVVVKIMYPNLSAQNSAVTINLLKLSSLSVILLPLMQTTASILIAIGKVYIPPITSVFSVVIKLITSYLLMKVPSINIIGAVISDILCYFVASVSNLVYIYIYTRKKRQVLSVSFNDVKNVGAQNNE